MRLFGIPIIADFSDPGEIDSKLDRYNDLTPIVDSDDADADDPRWRQTMEEHVDLYYEIKERTNYQTEDEDEQPRGLWSRLFG